MWKITRNEGWGRKAPLLTEAFLTKQLLGCLKCTNPDTICLNYLVKDHTFIDVDEYLPYSPKSLFQRMIERWRILGHQSKKGLSGLSPRMVLKMDS